MASRVGSTSTTETRLLRSLAARGDRAGAHAAAALLALARELGAVVESQEANVAIYWPGDARAGTSRVTLFLLAQEAGTLWLRKQGDWVAANYEQRIESAFHQAWQAWFPKREVFGRSGGKHRDAPPLHEIARILPEVEQLLRDTIRQLRGVATVHRTLQERQWLEKLASAVRARLDGLPGAGLLGAVAKEAVDTDEDSDGWWISLGEVQRANATLLMFVDNALGTDRRALWYGAGAESRVRIAAVDAAGRRRWPHVQRWDEGPEPPGFRHDDPWLQHLYEREHYWGWVERDPPDPGRPAPLELVDRIADRLSGLLAEMPAADSRKVALHELARLDGAREVAVRLEQSLLRRLLLSGASTGACALCGREFPVELLVAAHVKRRADCTDEERRDHVNNLIALCACGCDALFERGFVVVRDGVIRRGPREPGTDEVARRVEALLGTSRQVPWWSADRKPYFETHAARFTSE